ncbi:carbohydrate sulfotransferase 15-like isoform X2 [Apostichopus japonicus]|uniref:carbohydrate sulfotransferase 15-like isoform X2 n=1 Tax=Stichopus japonicus TaxID=307972 RepID=UPI003AB8D0B5
MDSIGFVGHLTLQQRWYKPMWMIALLLCCFGISILSVRYDQFGTPVQTIKYLPIKVTDQIRSSNYTTDTITVVHESHLNTKQPTSIQNLLNRSGWQLNSTISSALRQLSLGYYRNPADIKKKSSSRPIPHGLKKLRPLIFKHVPEFLPDYKNPCYQTAGTNSKMICLPYFFLLGNPKCGTTDIFARINGHPDIFGKFKEMHWWTRTSKSTRMQDLQIYSSKFILKGIIAARRSATGSAETAIVGDGSASTFWDNEGWETFYPQHYESGPPYVAADLIHHFLPSAKLIVSFRDPTARLYSGYLFFNRPGKPGKPTGVKTSPEDFHKRVVAELEIFNNCTSHRSIRSCVYTQHKYLSRVRVSLYIVPLLDWLRVYPREQLYIIKLEEWHQQCNRILAEVYHFLEIRKLSVNKIDEICSQEIKNEYHQKTNSGPMLNSTREILRNFYRPYVLELASVLNDTRFLWDYLES